MINWKREQNHPNCALFGSYELSRVCFEVPIMAKFEGKDFLFNFFLLIFLAVVVVVAFPDKISTLVKRH